MNVSGKIAVNPNCCAASADFTDNPISANTHEKA